jgi:hypothetical protein
LKLKGVFEAVAYCPTPGIMEYWNDDFIGKFLIY